MAGTTDRRLFTIRHSEFVIRHEKFPLAASPRTHRKTHRAIGLSVPSGLTEVRPEITING